MAVAASVLVGVAAAVFAVAGAITSDMDVVVRGLLGTGLFGLIAFGSWRYGVHPLIGATAAGVVVRNPIRSYVIPWGSPGYSGVEIQRRERRSVVAWAVQKTNLAQWFGQTVRADEVAAYIRARADAEAPSD